ncbi:class I adenylate-forming enzyme family protein [Granulicoccus phenolivorans]|uniref:class I adenylate-forming enzyme family protein n=1 Tax=Granulicoccus phenolivorans TaxID=266854 RepID=UPI0004169F29|nr:class I adenylate-forming enzyme family protein [Granulicoccus phenolivorans]
MPPDHQRTLADLVAGHALRRPTAEALIEPGPPRRRVTWAELQERVEATAAGYAARDLVPGDRVLIAAALTIDTVVCYLAALRAGLVAVPINPHQTATELRGVIEHSGARLLVEAAEVADPAPVGSGIRRVAPPELLAPGPVPDPAPVDPESLAAIVYTAGTSGSPKAVMLSHRALLAHNAHMHALDVFRPGTIALALLPLYHVFGLNALLGQALYEGIATVLADPLPPSICRLIVAERVSHVAVTPTVLYRMLADPELEAAAGTLRTITSGAAPLATALANQFTQRTGLAVQQGYGLSEAAPGVATTLGGTFLGNGHVGRPYAGVEVRIAPYEGAPPVPIGPAAADAGEIVIRGANLFSGYWPDGAGGPDADGWFATGDLGYLADGELFVLARLRELIIVAGFNVYPQEIEAVLESHPDVESAAVIGEPDEQTGERVIAFVTGSVLVSELLAYAAERLSRYKVPARILVLGAMPRTPTGKLRKSLLRDLLDRAEADE